MYFLYWQVATSILVEVSVRTSKTQGKHNTEVVIEEADSWLEVCRFLTTLTHLK